MRTKLWGLAWTVLSADLWGTIHWTPVGPITVLGIKEWLSPEGKTSPWPKGLEWGGSGDRGPLLTPWCSGSPKVAGSSTLSLRVPTQEMEWPKVTDRCPLLPLKLWLKRFHGDQHRRNEERWRKGTQVSSRKGTNRYCPRKECLQPQGQSPHRPVPRTAHRVHLAPEGAGQILVLKWTVLRQEGKALRREEGSAQGDWDGVGPQSWDVGSSKSESSPAQICLMGMMVPCPGEERKEKGKMTESLNLEFEPKIYPCWNTHWRGDLGVSSPPTPPPTPGCPEHPLRTPGTLLCSWHREAGTLPWPSWMNLGRLFNSSELWFLHLKKCSNKGFC